MARLTAYIEIHEYKVPSESGVRQEKPSDVVGFQRRLVNAIFHVAFQSTNVCEGPLWVWLCSGCRACLKFSLSSSSAWVS